MPVRLAKMPRIFVSSIMLLCVFTAAVGYGQRQGGTELLSGTGFRNKLETLVGVDWAAEPLRNKLDSLSDNLHIALWLDRRIDPSREPDLSIRETPLRRCFELIAADMNAGVSYIGPVVYFGPKETANRLATVAAMRNDEATKLPTAIRNRLLRAEPSSWPMLSTPRELLAEFAAEFDVEFVDLQVIPHDLWPEVSLPPLTFAERLTLLLAGFDLTYELIPSGRKLQVKLLPMPGNPVLVREYPLSNEAARSMGQIEQAAPTAQIRREGTRLVVIGRAEDHDNVSRLLKGEKVRVPAATAKAKGKTVYTMKGPSSLGTVLKTLQVQAGLNITIDASAESKLRDRVMFDVREASLEELILAVLKDTGLKFELTEKNLRVFE